MSSSTKFQGSFNDLLPNFLPRIFLSLDFPTERLSFITTDNTLEPPHGPVWSDLIAQGENHVRLINNSNRGEDLTFINPRE